MNRPERWIVLSLLALTQGSLAVLSAQDPTAERRQVLSALAESTRPGKEHAVLEAMAGTWDLSVEHSAGAGAHLSRASGKAVHKLLMDGRYLQQEMETQLVGLPYHVFSMLGYDKEQGKYWGMWVDNLTTALTTVTGTYDPASKVLTMIGTAPDPATGKPRMRSRSLLTFTDPEHFKLEVFNFTPKGDETKSLTVIYARR